MSQDNNLLAITDGNPDMQKVCTLYWYEYLKPEATEWKATNYLILTNKRDVLDWVYMLRGKADKQGIDMKFRLASQEVNLHIDSISDKIIHDD